MNLSEQFETYAATKLATMAPRTQSVYRRCVNQFIDAMGDLTCDEITPDVCRKFAALQEGHGIARRSARRRGYRVLRVARDMDADQRVYDTQEPAYREYDGSLASYVDASYLGFIKQGLAPRSQWAIRRAVELFNEWYGDDANADDVTPDLLEQFEDADTTPVRKAYAGHLRAVMRSYKPEEFPPAPRGQEVLGLQGDDGPPGLLNAFFEQVYRPLALRSRRERSVDLYRITLRKFEESLGRAAMVDDLNDSTVNAFAAWRLSGGVSKHTVNKDLFNLLAIWRWSHRKGYVKDWPDVEMEKAPNTTPQAWTLEEFSALCRAAGELPGEFQGVPGAVWWVAILLVCWDTGERVGAVLALSWGDVSASDGWVRFDASHRKGGQQDSMAKLDPSTCKAVATLRAWRQSQEDFDPAGPVFGFANARNHIYPVFSKLLKAAGLPDDSKSKFHRIRKTSASYLTLAGGDATEFLRHSSRDVTKRYLDPRIIGATQAVDLLPRPVCNGDAQ